MAAEPEEIVIDADPIDAQHLGPDLREQLFGRSARREICRCRRAPLGRRQRLAIDLAVRRQRQCIEHDERRRDHVLGQGKLEMRAQLGRVERWFTDDVSDQAFIAGRVLAREDRDFTDGRELRDLGFDLAELDAESADLHLLVDPAHELEIAVRQPANEIASAIQAALAERIRDKPLRGEHRPTQVAACEPIPTSVELARDTDWDEVLIRVEHVYRRARDRPADRNARHRARSTWHVVATRERRILGRAVAVDHRAR